MDHRSAAHQWFRAEWHGKATQLLEMCREVVDREKQMRLEAERGPRRFRYDPTNGDELAEQERRDRRQRELAGTAEEQ
jgi:hypothetical protein